MTTVTIDQMKDKLLTIEQVTQQLQKTEPLTTEHLSSEAKVAFKLQPDWAHGIDSMGGTDTVGAAMTINGVERQLTKEAALQAGANFGLPAPYMKKVPAHYIEGLLNYHYNGGMGDTEYSVLSVGDNISAFTRPTLVPFSNLNLLEKTVEGIQTRHGQDAQIFADYKFQNSLFQTDVRLIVPAQERVMIDTQMQDVPTGQQDVWMAGLHLSNSLVGKKQTTLEAYMFRWWCTNGATTSLEGIGNWSRRSNGQNDDIYEWARETVEEVLGGLEYRFDQVQALTMLNVAGNTADVLREIFREYEVPVSQRDAIMARLLESETLTMYSIMQAITQVANEADMEDRRRDRLMRIGGALPTEHFDTLKAQVWREGHLADPTAPNPYEIQVIAAVA